MIARNYDAIVIGARCAGASTAMLLARKGFKVLLVDRAAFPSDIPHGHYIHRLGPRYLARRGVLDRVAATNCPAVTTMTWDAGDFPLAGEELCVDGVALGTARADRSSTRCSSMRPSKRASSSERPSALMASRQMAIDAIPDLSDRVRNGHREERFAGCADLPNFFRKPYGLGWALVGDAGVHKDPFLALGICDAFRDAELLTTALDACFTYRRPLYGGLSEYESRRNEATTPDFHENLAAARFLPLPEEVYRRRESRAPHGGGTSDGLIAPR